MTEDTRFFIGLGVTVIINAAFIGAAWGSLMAGQQRMKDDIEKLERSLGLSNGQPGRFVTREEFVLVREGSDNERRELHRRLESLEESS